MKGEHEELICFKYIRIKKYKSHVRNSMMKIEVEKKKKKETRIFNQNISHIENTSPIFCLLHNNNVIR